MYALLTGFGPPVIRAAFMFSVLILGKLFHRSTLSYNSLSLSALLLLLIQPKILFDLSFIMSYAAMLSIIMFYPVLNNLIRPVNGLLKYIWQLGCISLAAQFFIIPVSAYYFNQFSIVFLISGVLATPFAFLVLFLTFLLIFDWYTLQLFHQLIAVFLTRLTHIFNKIIFTLDQWSFAAVTEVYLSPINVILIVLTVFVLYAFLVHKSKILFFAVLALLNLFLLSINIELQYKSSQNSICIYSDRKSTTLDIFYRGNCYSWNDLDPVNPAANYCNKNHRIANYIKDVFPLKSQNNDAFLEAGLMVCSADGHSVGVLYGDQLFTMGCYKIDLLVLNTSDFTLIREVLDNIMVKTLIIPKKYSKELRQLQYDLVTEYQVFNIGENGAFKFTF
jgi:ComEC/Rec2-related protein